MRCVFCDEQAVSYHRFQQELPPQADEYGDLWRTFRLVGGLFGFCELHGKQFDRYNFYVRETCQPETDEYLGEGRYRTPSGHIYRVLEQGESGAPAVAPEPVTPQARKWRYEW